MSTQNPHDYDINHYLETALSRLRSGEFTDDERREYTELLAEALGYDTPPNELFRQSLSAFTASTQFIADNADFEHRLPETWRAILDNISKSRAAFLELEKHHTSSINDLIGQYVVASLDSTSEVTDQMLGNTRKVNDLFLAMIEQFSPGQRPPDPDRVALTSLIQTHMPREINYDSRRSRERLRQAQERASSEVHRLHLTCMLHALGESQQRIGELLPTSQSLVSLDLERIRKSLFNNVWLPYLFEDASMNLMKRGDADSIWMPVYPGEPSGEHIILAIHENPGRIRTLEAYLEDLISRINTLIFDNANMIQEMRSNRPGEPTFHIAISLGWWDKTYHYEFSEFEKSAKKVIGNAQLAQTTQRMNLRDIDLNSYLGSTTT